MSEFHARIYGRVQMVMFRDFVQRKARARRLAGYVRNMPDGSLEAVVQGDKTALETFIPLLHKGPLLAKVERVDIEWRDPQERFDDFEIQY